MIIAAVAAYVAGTFLLSALWVRFFPDMRGPRSIRKNVALFLVMPVLLAVDAVRLLEPLAQAGSLLVRRLFELLSGRRLYRRGSNYYLRLIRPARRSGNRLAPGRARKRYSRTRRHVSR